MIESEETLSREPLHAELRWDLGSDFAGCSVKLNPCRLQLHSCQKVNFTFVFEFVLSQIARQTLTTVSQNVGNRPVVL